MADFNNQSPDIKVLQLEAPQHTQLPMLNIDGEDINALASQACLGENLSQRQAICRKSKAAVRAAEDVAAVRRLRYAVVNHLTAPVVLQPWDEARVCLDAEPLPSEAPVEHDRVAVLEGEARPDVDVEAATPRLCMALSKEVPGEEPVLAELRRGTRPAAGGFLSTEAGEALAIQWEGVGVAELGDGHARHAGAPDAITPPHEQRLVPEHVQEATGGAAGLPLRREATQREPGDGDVSLAGDPLQEPFEGEPRRVLRDDGEVARSFDALRYSARVPQGRRATRRCKPHSARELGLQCRQEALCLAAVGIRDPERRHGRPRAAKDEARDLEGAAAQAVVAHVPDLRHAGHLHAPRGLAHEDHLPLL
mmetsp:Transcript_65137/g.209994  ORF Transcript_65137/g.209994 Transcript_65137/m.209994 type:complete len:365 (-) Transcript_65137:382-1476(-)